MGRASPFVRLSGPAPTLAETWTAVIGSADLASILSWPPDVFALVDRALEASEAYRFLVSPPAGSPLPDVAEIRSHAHEWLDRLDAGDAGSPEVVEDLWSVAIAGADVPIEGLACGEPWPLVETLLALHAVTDEVCAGLGNALAAAAGSGWSFRAHARELLAESGSLSRINPSVLRVLPRCRTAMAGISIRSLSRHVWVASPRVDVEWHRMLARPAGVTVPQQHANIVVLPWPLRIRAKDFRYVPYVLPNMDVAEFGFFEFDPDEALDLDRVEAVMRAAEDEAGAVDCVMLPEASITPADIEPLEALLGEHGVWCLVAGVRESAAGSADGLGANWVHTSVRQGDVWRHVRQDKHHRWSLDRRQVTQYHLGGSLSPTKRWWEAIAIPQRSLQVIDQGVLTFASLVCEDLARLEPVADVVRAIGPSLVVTLLLDGPQLASRWTARYASVLADDPGSAVCTVTSYGMASRCRPPGCVPSNVIGLWKDASGTVTEITLDDGADAVLIATSVSFGTSVTADGRRHPGTSTVTLAGVHSISADAEIERGHEATARRIAPPGLTEEELTKATSWAEAFAEIAVSDPEMIGDVLDLARRDDGRAELGLPSISSPVRRAIDALTHELRDPSLAGIVAAAERLRSSDVPVEEATGTVLSIALEQRVFVEVAAGRLAPTVFEVFAEHG